MKRYSPNQLLIQVKAPVIILLLLLSLVGLAFAQPLKDLNPIALIIAGEAGGEGYRGMYAVACVIQNRNGDLRGFAGIRNKVALKNYYALKKTIDDLVSRMGTLQDITGGATRFENLEDFGWPKDDPHKRLTVTKVIGHHTFFKEGER